MMRRAGSGVPGATGRPLAACESFPSKAFPAPAEATARDVMTRNLVVVKLRTPLSAVVRIMRRRRISGVPVVDDSGRLAGIVTKSDLVARWPLPAGARVEDVYTPCVIAAGAGTSLRVLAKLMVAHRVHRVLIVRGQTLVGIVSSMDVMRHLARPLASPIDVPVRAAAVARSGTRRPDDSRARWRKPCRIARGFSGRTRSASSTGASNGR
jgi:CBS domain-containing protein